MNDKEVTLKAEDLTAKAEHGDTNSLRNEFNTMSQQDQLAVVRKMDEINAKHRAEDSSLPDIAYSTSLDDKTHSQRLHDVDINPSDGRSIQVGTDKSMRVLDQTGRIQETTDPWGNKRSYLYDNHGNLAGVSFDGQLWTTRDGEVWQKDGAGSPQDEWKGFITLDPDGTFATTGKDGVMSIEYPDGTTLTRASDGTTTRVDPDGTVSVVKPDGSWTSMDPQGKVRTGH